jgi:unsaturated rhamnogalacturonyl hydrolase
MGWYAMALVDTLDHLPEDHKGRDRIIAILNEVVSSLMKVRDEEAKLWYQVLDMGDEEGNYLEASASAMYVYVFAKASKNGYIGSEFFDYAMESFDGMLDEFITVDDDGMVSMQNIVGGTGLGGDPYRDGSFEYYISEDIIENDAKGIGPFILAAIELDR